MNTPSHPPLTIMAAQFWPQKHGGVESRLWHMARALAKLDQPVRVITENRQSLVASQTIVPYLSVRRFDLMNHGKLWRWPGLVQVKWWMNALKQERPAGAIWATQPSMAVAAILAGYRQQLIFNPACCAAAMRDLYERDTNVWTMNQPRLTIKLERFALRYSRRVVVSSENLARQFTQFHGQKRAVEVLHPATAVVDCQGPEHAIERDAARHRWGIDPDTFTLGFTGRLDPCKDLEFLFQGVAASELARQKNRLSILIAGDGPDGPRLKALAKQMGLERLITWTGRLDKPAEAYAAMDALALTSVYEAFGQVILEAMAWGVPVLGRRTDAPHVLTACDEIITHGHDGLLINAHDPQSLARSIDALAQATPWRGTLGANARRTAESRNWRHYAHRVLDQLDTLNLNGRRTRPSLPPATPLVFNRPLTNQKQAA